MSNVVLGLDMGPNSIGWALVRDGKNAELIDAGVRVFAEGVDAFDTGKEKSKNEARRLARAMRRQNRRRVHRRKQLITSLIELNLWPDNKDEQTRMYEKDPFVLRSRATSQPLEPFEIGRILLHLNQRRGFLSNRKKDRGDKETQGMLAEINQNERQRLQGGFETIGAFLADKHQSLEHSNRQQDDHVRARHLSRRQIFQEFEAIWNFQKAHHPALLTDHARWGNRVRPKNAELAIKPVQPIAKSDPQRGRSSDLESFGIEGLIFFQRHMYWPKSVVGSCELEPKQRRCPKADRHAERFRVLQEVNNLRYVDPDTGLPSALSPDQRTLLLDLLQRKSVASFSQIRSKLDFLDSVKFNLERGKRSSIKGMTLDAECAKHIGPEWHDWDESRKDAIVELLRENQNDDDLVLQSLIQQFGLTAQQADAALNVDLPVGYIMLSRIAIDRLMPHLERGLIYQSQSDPKRSALHAAGYLRRDELQRRLFDSLPDFTRVSPADCRIGDLPNPVVKRALFELRKVVNAIIREYGKPDEVHVEMARSLQMGREKRKEYNTRMRENEKQRGDAAKAIRTIGERPSRDSILKYRLWQQQSLQCIYCGKTISQNQLHGGATDIDHILPRSLTLDDSQSNKVLCHRECNAAKNQQSPYQWLHVDAPVRYEQVCQRAAQLLKAGQMPYAKYKRFFQKEIVSRDFINRQLNDTGYITRATVEFLQLLFDKPSKVLGLKGQLTAELRWQWGLDTILSELPDSPAWQEQDKLNAGEKNRADHRHHAIDAIVVALTNRSRLQSLSKTMRARISRNDDGRVPVPWVNFRSSIARRIATINVSHRVERKVKGALHEETIYGKTDTANAWANRKPLADLTPAEVNRIRDCAIRKLVIARLSEAGIDLARGKKPDASKMKSALTNVCMPSGVPIKRVRLLKPEKTIQMLRSVDASSQAYVKPGSTHHLCIFEIHKDSKSKREAVFVTTLEAAKRIKDGIKIIQRTHPDYPDATFLMSLSSRELVLAELNGQEVLLQFKSAKSTTQQMEFAVHSDARRSSNRSKVLFTPNTLLARKVTVDPLGRRRWAKD
ncbi:type II CRISPR RNA-guided endonuclease Cas9 [Novipirellula sp.]|uniref:type II CRISPR RNA-guided endonuclease Cas9 n=1 Tax=Novipirellula sp. TaxID=2795430 RepID=UPI0035665115